MTKDRMEKKIQRLFDEYDKRKKRINEQYDRAFDSAISAIQVLMVQEWHTREEERLALWYRKEIKKLDKEWKELEK